MRSLSAFETVMLGLFTSVAATAACSSGGAGSLDGVGAGDAGSDGKLANTDAKADGDANDIFECKPPPPEVTVVPMEARFCVGYVAPPDAGDAGDGAVDAGVDPATCGLNCSAACAWNNAPECDRKSATEVECVTRYPCGREPEGFAPLTRARTLGELLAHYAVLEAGAVHAFERMARELDAHGAPASLVAEAHAAADDERRHTQVMRALAARHGQTAPSPAPSPMHVRPLFAVALENAVEGCVREAFGAMVALHQSEHVPDARLQRAMASIARDELRHAELSFRVAKWVEDRLSSEERDAIRLAKASAQEELLSEPVLPIWRECGLPGPERARALAHALVRGDEALMAAARAGLRAA